MEKHLKWLKDRWKRLAVIAGLSIVVASAALYHFVWSKDPAEQAVRELFVAVSDNRLDEALSSVDPDSDIARYWNENRTGIQGRARDALAKYKVSFDLELRVTTRGDTAEAQLVDGTIKVSSRDPGAKGAFPVSLKSLSLTFYLEKKGGKWLITGINYEDLDQLADKIRF